MSDQLPVPKSKRRAERSRELSPERVYDPGVLHVHQPQEARFIVQQDAYALRLPHQSHGDCFSIGHGKPLPLSVAEHPGGAGGAHAVVPGHQGLCNAQAKFLRLFDRHLPVVSPAADLLVTENNSPVSEALRVVLDMGGVYAQHAVDDTSVFFEEVQAAVGGALIEFELNICEDKNTTDMHHYIQNPTGLMHL